jgi:hypothetical protein
VRARSLKSPLKQGSKRVAHTRKARLRRCVVVADIAACNKAVLMRVFETVRYALREARHNRYLQCEHNRCIYRIIRDRAARSEHSGRIVRIVACDALQALEYVHKRWPQPLRRHGPYRHNPHPDQVKEQFRPRRRCKRTIKHVRNACAL